MTASAASLERSFNEYEQPIRVQNAKVCCIVAGIFMPAGLVLDYLKYDYDTMIGFLPHRFICSLLLGLLWFALHYCPPHRTRLAWVLGHLVALFPLISISWMIYTTEGAASPYYAGLNLVNLGSAMLLRWSFSDSALIFALTLVAYLVATFLHGPIINMGLYYNNLYFLSVTGVFIVAGSWLYNNIRRSEFQLRYSLDENRAELEASNQKLRELDEAKNRFFANISHELRTPLTLMIAPLESIIHREDASRDPQERELLSTMHGNAMRLLKLINDLLDLVRLETGRAQVRTQRVSLGEFVPGLANAVSAVAQDKRINLQARVTPGLDVVMTDPEKLERICLNLLFNALKFTAAGGRVDICASDEDGWLIVEVRDTGMGIPADQLPHIFGRFWQADTSSQRKF
ncbi:MAG TPA: HAMP domain-containing sensor histidine kinase, partial [Prosthecobacter sp.]